MFKFFNNQKIFTPTLYGGEYFVSKAPHKNEIAIRAYCLSALLVRNEYEMSMQNIESDPIFSTKDTEILQSLNKWCTSEEIESSFSTSEHKLYKKKVGTWSRQEIINISWRNQSLGVLLWALSLYDEMVAYDDGFRLNENLFNRLGVLIPMKEFSKRIKLRSIEEIRFQRDVAEHWHWRCRTHEIIKSGRTSPENTSWNEIITRSADTGYSDKTNPKPINGDFPVNGIAFKDLSEGNFAVIRSSIMERHYALNWLCGYSKNWDEVSTDT